MRPFILTTIGFRSLDPDIQADIMKLGLKLVNKKTDMVVFDPDDSKNYDKIIARKINGKYYRVRFEDGDRTLRVHFPEIDKRVYAKLDDYGSAENLSENAGMELNTQYALTFLLAEEY